jgi:NADP-dependent 3-hydroxy acid dehydrogenase YdfG
MLYSFMVQIPRVDSISNIQRRPRLRAAFVRRDKMKDLDGKVVAITGAASGIGLELARGFAKKGAKLAIADINEKGLQAVKNELESSGSKVYAQTVDVTKKEQIKEFCDNVYNKMGRVDVLCNNAGVGWGGKVEDFPLDAWDKIIDINIKSVIYGCHYFYPRMIKQGGGGHILNTSSGAGLAPNPLSSAYCCTKFAVQGFTETFRAEAALNGIGVTSLNPGVVKTNITVTGVSYTRTAKSTPEEFHKKVDALYIKRNYTPDRVAKKAIKAVQKNKAVCRVCPETYLSDWIHRISRGLSIFQAKKTVEYFMANL